MEFNEEFISNYAEIFKALSHPIRLCIVLDLYNNKDGRNVSNLQAGIGISQSSVSQHLRILKQHDILDSHRHGTEIIYKLNNNEVLRIIQLLIA